MSKVAELKGFVSAIFKLMKKDSIEVCVYVHIYTSMWLWGIFRACKHHLLSVLFNENKVQMHMSRDDVVTMTFIC